ncbi:MAG: hypothetical protein JJE09_15430 [Bacteroidia bacterium]|nr:hypothetical protein [Bacteroidia bacterium]
MRKLVFVLLPILLVVFISTDSIAQFNRKSIKKNNKRLSNFKGRKQGFSKDKKYNSLGISVSALNYYGDIAPRPQRISTDISFTRPAIGLNFIHRFGPFYSLQTQLMYGVLKGSDSQTADPTGETSQYRYKRNASFRNQIVELSVVGVFDLFKNEATYISRVKWTPYVYVGLAGFTNNPKAQAPATDLTGAPLAEAGKWVKLRPLGTEGQHSTLDQTDVNFGIKPYKGFQIAIPFGLGGRFRINEVMDLWADIGFRYTFTDYIDDVSQNYVGLEKLNGQLAKAMSYRTNEIPGQPLNPTNTPSGIVVEAGYGHEHRDNVRGSKDDRDIYMVTSFRLTYIIGAILHKAKFR